MINPEIRRKHKLKKLTRFISSKRRKGLFISLNDIWQYYDVVDRKKFCAHDISDVITSIPKNNSLIQQCRFETMAFDFSENCEEMNWGTYYGPKFTFKRNDTGEDVYVPNIIDVTAEAIAYWESRSKVVHNPLLKMRYLGLVLEFKKRIIGKEPDYKSIKLAHIQAIIDVLEGDYCKYDIEALNYAERALSLSIKYSSEDLQRKTIKAYFQVHQRYKDDDLKPGLWGRIFQSLIKHRAYFSEYEAVLLKEQLDRYNRLNSLALENGNQTDRYAHVLEDQVDLLADYYQLIGEQNKIEPLLDSLLEALIVSIPLRGGLWGQSMYQQMQYRYRKYHFDKRANQLYLDLKDLGELTLRELTPVEYTIPLESDRIKAFLNTALEGSVREVLLFYMVQYLPRLDDEKRRLKEKTERSPLLEMVSTVVIDSYGNPISRVGVGSHAEQQRLYFSMYENMRFEIPFMHLHITKMKEEGKMTIESMMSMFEGSMLITDDHRYIVRKGFEAYLNENYLVCCHLLVPQLEAAVRRLFALGGINIMRAKGDPIEGNEYRSLDSLLDSDDAINIMGEDMANYLRNVLTSQYGWNIRNLVSHGLLSSDSFNYGMADRLIHAFMLLSGFKPEE